MRILGSGLIAGAFFSFCCNCFSWRVIGLLLPVVDIIPHLAGDCECVAPRSFRAILATVETGRPPFIVVGVANTREGPAELAAPSAPVIDGGEDFSIGQRSHGPAALSVS